MNSALLVLSLVLLVIPLSAVCISDESQAADETLSEGALLISYNSENGTQFIVKETQTYCYRYVDLLLYGTGIASVTLDGSELNYSLPSSGILKLSYNWSPEETHSLSVRVGSESYDYDLTVRKSVSIKDLEDAEEYSEYISMTQTELNNQKLFTALTAFAASVVGLYLAFRIAQWRALNGAEYL